MHRLLVNNVTLIPQTEMSVWEKMIVTTMLHVLMRLDLTLAPATMALEVLASIVLVSLKR